MIDGKETPPMGLARMRLTVQGRTIVFTTAKRSAEMHLSIDSSATPKAIDLEMPGDTILGIYKWEGDSLTICHPNFPKQPRPKEFAAPSGSRLVMMVWKRK